MLTRISTLVMVLVFCLKADVISLYDWGFYNNGNIITDASKLQSNITWTDGFWQNGLGTISISIDGSSSNYNSIAMFFDYQIMVEENSYSNEYGAIIGSLQDSRLTYEIDEPGYGNGYYTGDIYDNFKFFKDYGFDGKNFYDGFTGEYLSDYQNSISDDVSMAMGWDFSLTNDQTATIEFTASNIAPTSGLYLAQMDRDAPENNVYLQTSLRINSVNVTEPNIFNLIFVGILFLILTYSNKLHLLKRWR